MKASQVQAADLPTTHIHYEAAMFSCSTTPFLIGRTESACRLYKAVGR